MPERIVFTAFESDEHGFSISVLLTQFFFVPPLCLIVGFLCGLITTSLWLGKPGVATDLIAHATFGLVGFCVGYRAQKKIPALDVSGGRWVWIAPVALLLYGFYTDGVAAWFLSDHGDGIAIVLLTEPTIAACMYSVGVVTSARRSSKEPRV